MKQAFLHVEKEKETEFLEGTSNVLMVRHFFNARGVELERNFFGLIRSLLWQILSQARHLLEKFIPDFHKKRSTYRSGWEWHAEELRAFMLSTLASQLPPTYLYIDALDECEESERQNVVAFIEALMCRARSSDISLRVIFSSRHFPDIDIEACEEIHPEEHNSTAISIYVKQCLSTLPDTKGALILGYEIVRKAQGIFLWVVLVTDILRAKGNEPVQVMRDKLQQIPPGLMKLYDMILKGLSHEDHENMLLIIQWVLFAESPLTLKELFTAMAFDDGNKHPSFKAWRESDMFIEGLSRIMWLIHNSSWGMIEIKWDHDDNTEWSGTTLERPGTVQFIHESVRGFFLHDNEDALAILAPALKEKFVGSSHDRLARSCFNLLSNEELQVRYGPQSSKWKELMRVREGDGVDNDNKNNDDGEAEYGDDTDRVGVTELDLYTAALGHIKPPSLPLLAYASKHVFAHAWRAESSGMEQTHLVDLFGGNQSQSFKSWALLHDRVMKGSKSFELLVQGPRASLLYAASCYDLPSCVNILLQSGADPNLDCGNEQRFPLIAASALGHIKVVGLLLDHGADITALTEGRSTALCKAVGSEHLDMVRLLLNYGANIETPNENGMTALQFAVTKNNKPLVQLLLEHGASVETRDASGKTALQLAIKPEYEAIIRLLLDHGADIEAQDSYGETVVGSAVGTGDKAIMQLLRDYRANVQLQDQLHRTTVIETTSKISVTAALRPNTDSGYGDSIKSKSSILGLTPSRASLPDIEGSAVLESDERLLDHETNDDVVSVLSDDLDIKSRQATNKSQEQILAEEYIGHLLAQIEEMVLLCEEGLETIEKNNFVKNLRRLLKQYYLDLLEQAETNLEKATVHLLKSRWLRTRMAQQVGDKLRPESEEARTKLEQVIRGRKALLPNMEEWVAGIQAFAPSVERPKTSADIDNIEHGYSEEEDSDDDINTDTLSKVAEMKAFLLSGNPFRNLSVNLRIFLLPASLQPLVRTIMSIPNDPGNERIWFSKEEDNSFLNKFKAVVEDTSGEKWNWWPLRPRMRVLQPHETRMHWLCVRKLYYISDPNI